MATNLEARREVERVAASETFREAECVQRLLVYLGEAALNGRAEELKEHTIGVEVLGRPAGYEPRVDSSARMLASRLRRKLEDYYRGEGVADPVRIGFPKGSFKLTFEAVGAAPAARDNGDVRKWKAIAAVSACAALALAVYTGVGGSGPALGIPPEVAALWQPLLDRRAPVVVSFGSPLFVTVGGWLARRSDLNDWSQAAGHERLSQLQAALGSTARPYYGYAGTGDVSGAFLVGRLLGAHTGQLVLKRGAVLSWEDIQNNHLVFIGNGKSQEKIRYILDRLDFTLDGTGVHNRREAVEYRNPPLSAGVEYGLISSLPGSRQGRHMMILSANDTGAIWGVAEAVTNPRFAQPLVARLRGAGGMPKAWQAVVRITVNGDVPVACDYVTHREISADRIPLE